MKRRAISQSYQMRRFFLTKKVPTLASLLSCLLFGTALVLWLVFSIVGLDSGNINDLLINQEVFQPGKVGGKMDVKAAHSTSSSLVKSKGLTIMAKMNVTFIGVGKDVAVKLPSVLRQIEELAPFFSSSRAIFAEGDSKDGTDRLLQEWASRSSANRTILRTSSVNEKELSGHFAGQSMPREGRIAKARNVVLDALFNSPGVVPSDYVIVVDMDILGWDPNGVADSFGRPGWDVMCAHGILLHGIYRDTYAFRTEGMNTNHHWAGKDHAVYNISDANYTLLRSRLKTSQKRARDVMTAAMPDPQPNGGGSSNWLLSPWSYSNTEWKPLPVQSCFGGLAIYKYDKMQQCRYSYRHDEPPFMLDCEHVLLHKCMATKAGAKIFSNFNMKLWYGHSQFSSLSLKKVLSSLTLT